MRIIDPHITIKVFKIWYHTKQFGHRAKI